MRIQTTLISLVLLITMVANASQEDPVNSHSNLFSDDSGKAFATYKTFMLSGQPGYKILSDAWLSDKISENVWLDWSFTLGARFQPGQYQININEYHDFFSQRLEKDASFRSEVFKKLTSNEGYHGLYLLTWLGGGKGHREVAFEVLKKFYPSLPKFDVMATVGVRNEQRKNIENYLNKRL